MRTFLLLALCRFSQTINFYSIGSRLSLVDLPGYGFAFAADEKRESWSQLVGISLRISLVGSDLCALLQIVF